MDTPITDDTFSLSVNFALRHRSTYLTAVLHRAEASGRPRRIVSRLFLSFTICLPSATEMMDICRHFSNVNLSPDLTWNHVQEEDSHFSDFKVDQSGSEALNWGNTPRMWPAAQRRCGMI